MADHVLEACRRYGYLGAMSLTDALNLPEDELFWINRTALHDHYYEPFYSAYDPYRKHPPSPSRAGLAHRLLPLSAGKQPCIPTRTAPRPQLRQRFETVLSEGGDAVWCAVPEEGHSATI